jgi:hypothetical protein
VIAGKVVKLNRWNCEERVESKCVCENVCKMER